MTASAPRIGERLRREVARADDGKVPIAEVCRRVGAAAERIGVPRPSYQQVRVLVHETRRLRAGLRTRDVLVDVAFRVRPPNAILDHLAGTDTR